MPDLPNSLSLTSIADDAEIIASDHRNNYSATQTGVNGLITALSGGLVGQYLRATDSDTIAYSYPPGYELGRTAVVAGTTAISAGTEASPVDFASLTVTCDGTAVDVFSAGIVQWASGFTNGDIIGVNVWLDGVDQGRVFYDQVQQVAVGVSRATAFVPIRLTPTSGSRVFKLRGWCTAGGVKNLISGAGGAGAQSPAFIRVVKA